MRQRTFKDWVLATRPWSFTASIIPVVAITAYLFYQSLAYGWVGCDWWNALLALPMLMCLQAAGNLISDYYDHVRNVDLPGSLNGVRHIQSGKFAPREILRLGYVMLGAAALFGLVILARSSWSAVWLGAAGLLMAAFYPWLKFHALGDLDVLFGYALLPAVGVSFAVTGAYHPETLLLSLPFGLHTVAILHANNTRDILNDSRAGIRTLAMAIGPVASHWVYLAEILLPYALVAVYCLAGLLHPVTMLVAVTLPEAVKLIRVMMAAEPYAEAPIGGLDQRTARLQLCFGILFTVSFLIAAWML